MVMTASTMIDLGTKAPDFALPDTDGQTVSRSDFDGKPLLVVFMCNHCPFVMHVARQLKALGDDYMPKGLAMVGISANDVSTHPDDAPEKMKQEKADRGYPFPYLYDEDQSVAKAYTAACTPDVFLFNDKHELVYRGQLDETRPGKAADGGYDFDNPASDGKDIRAALDALLSGGEIPQQQIPSMGCNIKWKAGSEPEYFRA